MQLVKNNHWRKVMVDGKEKKQVAQTMPLNEMLLDEGSPYGGSFYPLVSNNEAEIFKYLYDDAPIVELSNQLLIKELHAEAEYTIYLLVRPEDLGGINVSKDTAWAPVKAFNWSWGGEVEHMSQNEWKVNKPIYTFGFDEKPITKVLNWSSVANVEWKEE